GLPVGLRGEGPGLRLADRRPRRGHAHGREAQRLGRAARLLPLPALADLLPELLQPPAGQLGLRLVAAQVELVLRVAGRRPLPADVANEQAVGRLAQLFLPRHRRHLAGPGRLPGHAPWRPCGSAIRGRNQTRNQTRCEVFGRNRPDSIVTSLEMTRASDFSEALEKWRRWASPSRPATPSATTARRCGTC